MDNVDDLGGFLIDYLDKRQEESQAARSAVYEFTPQPGGTEHQDAQRNVQLILASDALTPEQKHEALYEIAKYKGATEDPGFNPGWAPSA